MKIILIMATTVDGKIAENVDQPSLDWTSPVDTKFFVKKTKECGVMIMGNTTFATIGKPLPGRLSIVLTRDKVLETKSLPGQLEYTTSSPKEIVRNLEARGYKQAALIGGATINTLFLKAKCIDEIYLTIEPKIFGEGIGLFRGVPVHVDVELAGIEKLGDNVLNVHYIVKK
ncbi:MAG TPA: dihydrofolate reductase [Candidatus Magasanikbacteria bacterium]|nr:dihydrofolate reductase [Candidatus Magasanikbacteria bacterium]